MLNSFCYFNHFVSPLCQVWLPPRYRQLPGLGYRPSSCSTRELMGLASVYRIPSAAGTRPNTRGLAKSGRQSLLAQWTAKVPERTDKRKKACTLARSFIERLVDINFITRHRYTMDIWIQWYTSVFRKNAWNLFRVLWGACFV